MAMFVLTTLPTRHLNTEMVFDTVKYRKVCSCALTFNLLKLKIWKNLRFSSVKRDKKFCGISAVYNDPTEIWQGLVLLVHSCIPNLD